MSTTFRPTTSQRLYSDSSIRQITCQWRQLLIILCLIGVVTTINNSAVAAQEEIYFDDGNGNLRPLTDAELRQFNLTKKSSTETFHSRPEYPATSLSYNAYTAAKQEESLYSLPGAGNKSTTLSNNTVTTLSDNRPTALSNNYSTSADNIVDSSASGAAISEADTNISNDLTVCADWSLEVEPYPDNSTPDYTPPPSKPLLDEALALYLRSQEERLLKIYNLTPKWENIVARVDLEPVRQAEATTDGWGSRLVVAPVVWDFYGKRIAELENQRYIVLFGAAPERLEPSGQEKTAGLRAKGRFGQYDSVTNGVVRQAQRDFSSDDRSLSAATGRSGQQDQFAFESQVLEIRPVTEQQTYQTPAYQSPADVRANTRAKQQEYYIPITPANPNQYEQQENNNYYAKPEPIDRSAQKSSQVIMLDSMDFTSSPSSPSSSLLLSDRQVEKLPEVKNVTGFTSDQQNMQNNSNLLNSQINSSYNAQINLSLPDVDVPIAKLEEKMEYGSVYQKPSQDTNSDLSQNNWAEINMPPVTSVPDSNFGQSNLFDLPAFPQNNNVFSTPKNTDIQTEIVNVPTQPELDDNMKLMPRSFVSKPAIPGDENIDPAVNATVRAMQPAAPRKLSNQPGLPLPEQPSLSTSW